MAMTILIDRHAKLIESLGEAEGDAAWKKDFESDYCDDFDRALIVQDVCNILYPENKEKCSVGI
jgi:hypothetical protein